MIVRIICGAVFLLLTLNASGQDSTLPLPPAVVGSPYAHQIKVADDEPDLVFASGSRGLPSGLTLSKGGRLYGVPDLESQTSTFDIEIRHGEQGPIYARATFSLIVYSKLCEGSQKICHQVGDPTPAASVGGPATVTDRQVFETRDSKGHSQLAGSLATYPFNRANNTVTNGPTQVIVAETAPLGEPYFSDTKTVWAIVDSKVLLSGTVLVARSIDHCQSYDWTVTALSKESSNVLIYGPSDISEYCDEKDGITDLYAVIPVSTVWAELIGMPAPKNDPTRKAAGKIAPPVECNLREVQYPHLPSKGLVPCDRDSFLSRPYYSGNRIYNRLIQPGTTQGSISFSPVIGSGTEKFTNDVQFLISSRLGPGWIGFPLVFEKDINQKANLDSLSMALSYEFRGRRDWWNSGFKSSTSGVTIRKPELIFRGGPELAPTTPHNLNFATAGTMRVPFVFDFQKSPSALTVFPVIGIEGGSHIYTHTIAGPLPENSSLFRGVVGADASLRAPVLLSHGFLGTKPTTIDYSFRARYLAYAEPYTDEMLGSPTELLTNRRRTYSRITLGIPYSTYGQFKISVQRGSLPPDFRSLGWSLSLGITFLNPGISEH